MRFLLFSAPRRRHVAAATSLRMPKFARLISSARSFYLAAAPPIAAAMPSPSIKKSHGLWRKQPAMPPAQDDEFEDWPRMIFIRDHGNDHRIESWAERVKHGRTTEYAVLWHLVHETATGFVVPSVNNPKILPTIVSSKEKKDFGPSRSIRRVNPPPPYAAQLKAPLGNN